MRLRSIAGLGTSMPWAGSALASSWQRVIRAHVRLTRSVAPRPSTTDLRVDMFGPGLVALAIAFAPFVHAASPEWGQVS